MQATAGVKYSLTSNDVLFSDAADFAHCLEILASLRTDAIAGYCLLPNELHLLSLRQNSNLPMHLLHALTGDPHHPLVQMFRLQHLTTATLTSALLRLHTLPVTQALAASPDSYPWSSHHYYSGRQSAPAWLALESFWQLQDVRRSGWIRAYAAAINPDVHPLATSPVSSKYRPAQVSAELVIDRVLAHFCCNRGQLLHARMRRRREELGGIAWAACLQLGLQDPKPLMDCFAMDEAALTLSARQTPRQHSGFSHLLVTSLIEQAKPTRKQPAPATTPTLNATANLALVPPPELITPSRQERAVSLPAAKQ